MLLSSQYHDDLMGMFEREFSHCRLDREPRSMWARGNIYQNGETNSLFLAYRKGVAYGRATGRD